MDAVLRAKLSAFGLTWTEYLGSAYFREAMDRYAEAGLPGDCLGCGVADAPVRHRSYKRLGNESPTDLVPLCNECFARVEEFRRLTGAPPHHVHKTLRRLFKWSKRETEAKFTPWRLSGRPNGFYLTPACRQKVRHPRPSPLSARIRRKAVER